ncbi:MAG: hypothetical protein KAZ23_04305, partial [Burkholderiaceae bacterium]|nr:hypothetical protein [Burkholderiaceae bacterium]
IVLPHVIFHRLLARKSVPYQFAAHGFVERLSLNDCFRRAHIPPPFAWDVEKARQLRSRIARTLNVPLRVRLGPSLAAALLTAFLTIP